MKYYFVEPEVAGELGEHSVLDSSTHPPKVAKLHYKFSGWLGDAILESFPCVIATLAASAALEENGVTGVRFSELEISVSAEFREMYPQRKLPPFRWLKVFGAPGKDDFGIASDLRLVLSEKALELLRPFGIGHALVEPFA